MQRGMGIMARKAYSKAAEALYRKVRLSIFQHGIDAEVKVKALELVDLLDLTCELEAKVEQLEQRADVLVGIV